MVWNYWTHTGNMKDHSNTDIDCMGSTYKGSLNAGEGQNRINKAYCHIKYTFTNW